MGYDGKQLTPDDHPLPIISHVTPSFGPTSGRTEVRVDGSGFVAPCTLMFDGAAATDLAVVTPAIVTALTPPGTAGKVMPSIRCGSSSNSYGGAFTYQSDTPTPAIDPNSGGTGGGTL